MAVLFSSNHQTEFCENVIKKLLSKGCKSLVFFTRTGCVETSRNLLKIFSPLIDELSSSRSQEAAQEPLTLILPDTDAATVRVLLALLSRGKMPLTRTKPAHLQKLLKDVTSLGKCLGLDLNIDANSQPQASKPKLKVEVITIVDKKEEPDPEPSEYVEYLMPQNLSDLPKDSGGGEKSFSTLNEIPVKRLELDRRELMRRKKKERYENDFHDVSDSQGNRIFTCLNTRCKDLKFHANSIETFNDHLSEGELVSSDEDQNQSFTDDSRSIVENVGVGATQIEELRLRCKKRVESLPAKDPSVGQDDNIKISTANLQENETSHNEVKKKRKIYLGNLPTEGVSKEEIEAHFATFGTVVQVVRPVDKKKNNKPMNFAFITFESEETAKQLIKEGQTTINGHALTIRNDTRRDQGSWGGRGGGAGGIWVDGMEPYGYGAHMGYDGYGGGMGYGGQMGYDGCGGGMGFGAQMGYDGCGGGMGYGGQMGYDGYGGGMGYGGQGGGAPGAGDKMW